VDGEGVEPSSRTIGAPHRSFIPRKHTRPIFQRNCKH